MPSVTRSATRGSGISNLEALKSGCVPVGGYKLDVNADALAELRVPEFRT